MKKENWIWMPHTGHFICGYKCHFHLNTYVGGYIISTLGEMTTTDEFHNRAKTGNWEEIGLGRKYETMVFKAKKENNGCCPYVMNSGELDMMGYETAEEARKGHLKMCNKWSK